MRPARDSLARAAMPAAVWAARDSLAAFYTRGHGWDGGDDGDTTYVPSPEWVVVVDVLPDRPDICPPP